MPCAILPEWNIGIKAEHRIQYHTLRRSTSRISRTSFAAMPFTSLPAALAIGLYAVVATAAPYAEPRQAATWTPAINSTWQIVLNAPLQLSTSATATNPNVAIWDIDMEGNSASTIATLHRLNKKVICYFSAGSYEPNRSDSAQFTAADMGNTMEGWEDEIWVDIRSANVRKIMAARIKAAASKGCDAVDPDNVDGYNNNNGLGLTQQDTIDYVKWLSAQAAASGMSMGLKNALEILSQVQSSVAFAVNEQCYGYGECDMYASFVQSGKAAFHVEYPNRSIGRVSGKNLNNICSAGNLPSVPDPMVVMSTVLKNNDLSGLVQFCNGTVTNTPTK